MACLPQMTRPGASRSQTAFRSFCHRQGLQIGAARFAAIHQDRPVGAWGHGRPQSLLGGGGAARYRHHFAGDARFLELHGLFDGDFVEGIHAHLDVGEVDPLPSVLTRTLTL